MKLISVNIGKEQTIAKAKSGMTGIFKNPVASAVQLTSLGLVGDAVVDAKHHGGPDQAVYVYTEPDYAWWSQQLGRSLQPGAFGDNLTISGLESAQTRVGDRLRMGDVILEITAPRIPCGTLAARMEDPAFVKRFREAERPGFYCRVIQEGLVRAGTPVSYEPYQGDILTILEMYRDYYNPSLSEESLRRHLAAPIAIRDRISKEEKLRAILSTQGG